jgi:hypothetical protein
MPRPKPLPAAAVLFLGILLEPLGHEIAYDLRYGMARAAVLQAQGAHAYFPAVRSFSTLSLLTGLVLAIIAVSSVMFWLGQRRVPVAGLWRPFCLLAAAQVSLFFIQEVLEGISRGSIDLAFIALLTVFAQLPLAALSAMLLARLQGYLLLVPEAIRSILALRVTRHSRPGLVLLPLTDAAFKAQAVAAQAYSRRGPPRFS